MKLSLIVPVYNVEKYIERCLNSLVNQDLDQDEYEIIIVIDGSLDDSYLICESFKTKYNNIKIIYQQNKGLSGARNTGIANARGFYIWFIDSDDSIEINVLKNLYEFIIKFPTEIVNFGFNYIKKNDITNTYTPNYKLSSKILDINFFIKNADFKPMVWSYVFNRSFLQVNNLTFYEGILNEDEEFTVKSICVAKNILALNWTIYNYFENENSIMSGFKSKLTFDKFKILNSFEKLINKSEINSNYKDFINYRAYILIYTILLPNEFYRHSKSEKKEIISLIQNSYCYPIKRNSLFMGKHLIFLLIINFNINWFLLLRKIRG